MMVDVAFVMEPEGTILAIMPGVAAIAGYANHCACYRNVGPIDTSYVLNDCEQADPNQYDDLLEQLTRMGCDVNVIPIDRVRGSDYRETRIDPI